MGTPQRTVDVVAIIDKARLSSFQIRILILCAFVVLFDGFDAQSIAFVASRAAADLGMSVDSFGPIFGAGTLGMTCGALLLPPLADRWGRKWLIVASTLMFGIFSLTTVWCNSYWTLFVLRLLTGIGVGAAVPNLVPLVSEYAPRAMRNLLITIVSVSWPLGAVLGGLVSSKLLPIWGWHSVFLLAGILPILLALLLIPSLPESIRFLVAKAAPGAVIAAALNRIDRSIHCSETDHFVLTERDLRAPSIRRLFADRHAALTALLWLVFFMNFLVLFFMFNWLPPLMEHAGLPVEKAIIATVLFNLGGIIGAIALGRIMDRFRSNAILGFAYAVGALTVGSIGFLDRSIAAILADVLLSGVCVVGAQACGNALAANLYPTTVRSTGVGWTYGIGRMGSIVGPIAGGVFLTWQWNLRQLFIVAAIPLAFAAISMALLIRAERRRPSLKS